MIRYHKLKIRNFKCAFTKTTPKINLKKKSDKSFPDYGETHSAAVYIINCIF